MLCSRRIAVPSHERHAINHWTGDCVGRRQDRCPDNASVSGPPLGDSKLPVVPHLPKDEPRGDDNLTSEDEGCAVVLCLALTAA